MAKREKALKKFPHLVFVREETPSNDESFLVAGVTPGELVEDDGPTDIACYKLVNVARFTKSLNRGKHKGA